MRVNVLCQCGWGLLAIEEDQVPDECPVCGYLFHPADETDESIAV